MKRFGTLGLAVSLVALPSLFGIFPEWTQLPLFVRALVVGIWIPIVWATASAALRQTEQIGDLVGPALERRAKQKALAARRLLLLLLAHDPRLLPNYKFRLYTFDALRGELIPVFAPEDSDAESWPVGTGVTGEAWRRGEYVIARGSAVWDTTSGLTAQQRARYEHLAVVASMPVRDDRQNLVAILTASSRLDDGRLASPDGYDRHSELAQICGRILVDIAETQR